MLEIQLKTLFTQLFLIQCYVRVLAKAIKLLGLIKNVSIDVLKFSVETQIRHS